MATACLICQGYRPPEGIIMVLGEGAEQRWFEFCRDCLDRPGYFTSVLTGETATPRQVWNDLAYGKGEFPLDLEEFPMQDDIRPYVAFTDPYYVDEAFDLQYGGSEWGELGATWPREYDEQDAHREFCDDEQMVEWERLEAYDVWV